MNYKNCFPNSNYKILKFFFTAKRCMDMGTAKGEKLREKEASVRNTSVKPAKSF